MTEEELGAILALARETKRVEFKRSVSWVDPSAKAKLTKTILAMSNIRDGGVIVIGVDRAPDGTYLPVGINMVHANTFDSDEMGRHLLNYADPNVDFSSERVSWNGLPFLTIVVREFVEVPIVCRADGPEGLERGRIYTRNNVPETVPVPGETEMREILDMAVDKALRRLVERLTGAGLLQAMVIPQPPDDRAQFEAEVREFEP